MLVFCTMHMFFIVYSTCTTQYMNIYSAISLLDVITRRPPRQMLLRNSINITQLVRICVIYLIRYILYSCYNSHLLLVSQICRILGQKKSSPIGLCSLQLDIWNPYTICSVFLCISLRYPHRCSSPKVHGRESNQGPSLSKKATLEHHNQSRYVTQQGT